MRSVAYGSRPLPLPDALEATVCLPPGPVPETDLNDLLSTAIERPVASPPLSAMVEATDQVVVVINHGLVDEPRGAMVQAVLQELSAVPASQVRFIVAHEGRGPSSVAALGLGDLARRHEVLTPGPNDLAEMASLGTTSHGTRVRLPRQLVEASMVIMTGRIRPHVFSGFSGGADAVLPGLGLSEDIEQLQALAEDPSVRLGRVSNNIYRQELEAAVKLLPGRLFLLNVLFSHDRPLGAVAGHVVSAHRRGCELGRVAFEMSPGRGNIVLISDALPMTGTLADAVRLLAPAGLLLEPGGVVILAAECPRGIGRLDEVTLEAFERRLARYFPNGPASRPALFLVSSLPPSVVTQTLFQPAASIEEALAKAQDRVGAGKSVLVLPRAADVIPAAR